jgi:osmoprotectant transport system substrate-binding protein
MVLRRPLITTVIVATAALVLGGCGSSSPGPGPSASKPTITIGTANSEEQEIVANLYGDVLTNAGFKVTVEPALGTSAVAVPALEHGQIDLEPDYAASLLDYLHGGIPQPAGDQITTAESADRTALSSFGVTVLPASKALDTEVFAVTKATADQDHLTTISSLAPYASKMTLGGPPECATSAGCEPGLEQVYGLHFAAFKSLDEGGPLSVAALKTGEVQVVELFSSAGNVQANNFVTLTDDKHLEEANYIVPVIRQSVDTPAVATALAQLDNALTTDAISRLNIEVAVFKQQPAAVAKTWLKANGLI